MRHISIIPGHVAKIMRQASVFIEQRQKKKNIELKEKQIQEGKAKRQRGKDAEDRFLKAWEGRHPLVLSLSSRRASYLEDHNEKTDAWLEIRGYPPFRIQIKAYWTTKNEQHEFRRKGIVLVSVLPAYKHETIREQTLERIRMYLRTEGKKVTF